MKKVLFSLFIAASFTLSAQKATAVVTANGILASSTFMKANAKNVKSQKTFVDNAKLPQELSNISDFSKKSVITIVLKDDYYDKISLADMNLQNNLDANNPVMYDGMKITNTSVIIYGDVMQDIQVKTIDGKKVLNISSTPKS
ncbi:hypothetical protein [Frigoriflavimonas asaccharolytica]|uniref:TonB-dependent receptor n=1 Tax=Frigoriflavimonas asaccharolytica TaxID=2735899 RepID=A0A8J8K7T9_9FLAO|nr:hypothetical protein [Frigoriflavimonas asaccharolytica]NRS91846.1 hypothetical protein [Frigoriflavimonas asaccharolytica]